MASAEADAILGLTNSYVSLYSSLRQKTDDSLIPVPAEFRALAAASFNKNYNNSAHLTAQMVGVPKRYIVTPPDNNAVPILEAMTQEKSAAPHSQLIKREGSLTLRNMYPSVATEKSCVTCHNKIQTNNSNLWKIGDLMGAYVIERGVDAVHSRYVFFGTLLGLLISLLLAVALVALRQQQKLKAYASNLKDLANTDPLTGCLNRRALDAQFDSMEQNIALNSMLLILDIDHFKSINDAYGHDAGDAVLRWFSEEVRTHLRGEDLFARIGGEEFVVYIGSISQEVATRIAERIRNHIASSEFSYDDIQINVTVSIGAVYTGQKALQPLSRYTLIADKLLYAAKSRGRNQVAWSN